ncbi:MAG TPA: glycosyltransferase [Pirellulales bacterium]|nr:glycosyltransferase [Pirellulales bacterium]
MLAGDACHDLPANWSHGAGLGPRVSVIMAVRNCGSLLRASLESLARQCLSSFEIAIMDDASTDSTSEIIDELHRFNPSLAICAGRNFENQGIGASRNSALALATGEYVAILDGDDLCRADRLAQQVAFLDARPGCFCVSSTAVQLDREGSVAGILDFGVRTNDDVVRHLLAGLNPIINSSAMFRRKEAIEILRGYAAEGQAAVIEDLDFWYRAVLAGLRFQVLPDPLIWYRSNPLGHTRTRQREILAAQHSRLSEFRRDFERRRTSIVSTGAVAMDGDRRNGARPRRRSAAGSIRAAILTPVLQVGGAEQWLLSLAKRSDPSRIRWVGVALTEQAPVDADFCSEVARNVPVFGAEEAQGDAAVRCATAREALRAAASQADVLVAWGLRDTLPVLEAVDIPTVYVSHGSGEWSANCARAIEDHPVRLAAVSEAAREAFSPAKRPHVRVIHNGIEVDRCTPTRSRAAVRSAWGYDSRHRLVAYVGRYSEEKNPAAAALAVTRLPDHFYAIYAGAGRHEEMVRSLAWQIAGTRARFVAPERRIGNLLQAFDVVMLASPSEGFSLLLAEAWYCGVPVVATRVGAVPELEAAHGPLVSPVAIGAAADELAAAVEHALSPAFQREVVPRARALVAQKFTATRMADRWTDYLTEICREAARCGEPSP